MKAIKRKILRTFALLLTVWFCTCGSGCIGKALAEGVGKDIRQNSNFDFGFLQKVTSETSFEDCFVVPGFGITGYVPKKYGENYDTDEIPFHVQYSVTNWRDALSREKRVTSIDCHDSFYTLYGLKIGDTYALWEQVLTEKGFKLNSNENNGFNGTGTQRFYKHGIRINVNAREGEVFAFSLYAETTNLGGIVY